MAARTPDYTPVLVEGLQDQIAAILQRDFLANLNAINAGAAYPGILDYHKTEQDQYPNAPEALIEPIETVFANDEQHFLTANHVFSVGVFVTASGDNEQLAQMARDYARGLVWTLARKWDYSDYETPMPVTYDGVQRQSVGMTAGTVKDVFMRHVGWALKGTAAAMFARMPLVEMGFVTVED